MLKLQCKNIHLSFGENHVLRGLNASFSEGTLNSVIGVNGAGKSVFMKSIAGLLHCTGDIILSDEEKSYNRSSIAYVPQMAYSTSALTALEMVLLGKVNSLGWRVSNEILESVNRMMDKLQISHLAEKRFSELSGGQKQMVIMAQALISRPKLLLLDEPTSALDLYHQLQLLDVTREYCAQSRAIGIVVMHDLSLVARYSDEILLLHEGRELRQGAPGEVLEPAVLEKVYRVRLEVYKTPGGITSVTPIEVVKENEK